MFSEELKKEVESFTAPFSPETLRNLKEEMENIQRADAKYSKNRETMLKELDDLITELVSYGNKSRPRG